MPINLTTPQSQPDSTEVRLITFSATLWPQRSIVCDYAWGHLDGSGNFVPDPVPGEPDKKVKRRLFTDQSTPSFVTFVQNVAAAGAFRTQTETYLKSLDNLTGTVT
jgi:hypothetical protein